ncbi:hypothetical protein D1AOALGA4SA_8833 [Olavius algarvensis Delta 1 endosymbiont]|nr:hypothetical protein D1AOALGA4SA_8833 [Olavius algarvensis Delta 1 endosymbiont]
MNHLFKSPFLGSAGGLKPDARNPKPVYDPVWSEAQAGTPVYDPV